MFISIRQQQALLTALSQALLAQHKKTLELFCLALLISQATASLARIRLARSGAFADGVPLFDLPLPLNPRLCVTVVQFRFPSCVLLSCSNRVATCE